MTSMNTPAPSLNGGQQSLSRISEKGSMTPHPDSPNGLWAKHGYQIERLPRRGHSGHYRIIRDPKGRVVLQDAGYEGEMEWIRENLEVAYDQAQE